MPRPYRRKTNRLDANRNIKVRYEPRREIDVSRMAEVVIRVALHAADKNGSLSDAGSHLHDLLSPKG